VVVNDLNLLWPRGGPPKTDPPLVVDSNAELTPPVTFQGLEPISRGNPQLIESLRVPKLAKLAQRY